LYFPIPNSREQYEASPGKVWSLHTTIPSITLQVWSGIGLRNISHAYPPVTPNQVRLRCAPYAAYGFLQTLPLPTTPLPIGVTSPKSGCINKKVSIPCWAHQMFSYPHGENWINKQNKNGNSNCRWREIIVDVEHRTIVWRFFIISMLDILYPFIDISKRIL